MGLFCFDHATCAAPHSNALSSVRAWGLQKWDLLQRPQIRIQYNSVSDCPSGGLHRSLVKTSNRRERSFKSLELFLVCAFAFSPRARACSLLIVHIQIFCLVCRTRNNSLAPFGTECKASPPRPRHSRQNSQEKIEHI